MCLAGAYCIGKLLAFPQLSHIFKPSIVLDIQLWFDTTVSDVRIGNALNDSAYLNVSGYNLLRTSVTDDGTFEGVAFTVGETTQLHHFTNNC
jgi:hypothetical protein